jgi:hypothetical protein
LKTARQAAGLLLLAAGLGCACGLTVSPRPSPPPATLAAEPSTTAAPIVTPASGTEAPARAAAPPSIGGCQVFPGDNIWNARVDTLPHDNHSLAYVQSIGEDDTMHADFGSGIWPPDTGGPIGIPFVVVPGTQALVDMTFHWNDQSEPGPYPIPGNAPIEFGSDHHVLVVDQGNCSLYELYAAQAHNDGSWFAYAGAVYPLNSDALRPSGWTSADAAGLPILPGLVRYDEVASGAITHAIRFTAPQTRDEFIWPGRHQAGDPGDDLPPMGQRFRLKADYNISGFDPAARVILQALKTYGMILADNGSSWYISGAPDPRWDNDVLHELGQVPGSEFEAVDESSLMTNPDSGRAGPPVVYNHFIFLPNASN